MDVCMYIHTYEWMDGWMEGGRGGKTDTKGGVKQGKAPYLPRSITL